MSDGDRRHPDRRRRGPASGPRTHRQLGVLAVGRVGQAARTAPARRAPARAGRGCAPSSSARRQTISLVRRPSARRSSARPLRRGRTSRRPSRVEALAGAVACGCRRARQRSAWLASLRAPDQRLRAARSRRASATSEVDDDPGAVAHQPCRRASSTGAAAGPSRRGAQLAVGMRRGLFFCARRAVRLDEHRVRARLDLQGVELQHPVDQATAGSAGSGSLSASRARIDAELGRAGLGRTGRSASAGRALAVEVLLVGHRRARSPSRTASAPHPVAHPGRRCEPGSTNGPAKLLVARSSLNSAGVAVLRAPPR